MTYPWTEVGLTPGTVSLAPVGLNGRYFRIENAFSATFAQWSREIPGWVAAVHRDRPCWPPFEFNAQDARFRQKGRLSFLNAGADALGEARDYMIDRREILDNDREHTS